MADCVVAGTCQATQAGQAICQFELCVRHAVLPLAVHPSSMLAMQYINASHGTVRRRTWGDVSARAGARNVDADDHPLRRPRIVSRWDGSIEVPAMCVAVRGDRASVLRLLRLLSAIEDAVDAACVQLGAAAGAPMVYMVMVQPSAAAH